MAVIGLVIGLVLLAIGAQGAIRLLVDPTDAGVLTGLPEGVRLVAYVILAVVGVGLAAWAGGRIRAEEPSETE